MRHPAFRQTTPAAPTPADVRALAWGMVVLAATFIFARTPDILLQGRLFAEEGVIYFRDAVAGTWYDALLAPRVGYFSAFNKLAALAASAVPLEEAARVTTLCALAVQLTVVWLIAAPMPSARYGAGRWPRWRPWSRCPAPRCGSTPSTASFTSPPARPCCW